MSPSKIWLPTEPTTDWRLKTIASFTSFAFQSNFVFLDNNILRACWFVVWVQYYRCSCCSLSCGLERNFINKHVQGLCIHCCTTNCVCSYSDRYIYNIHLIIWMGAYLLLYIHQKNFVTFLKAKWRLHLIFIKYIILLLFKIIAKLVILTKSYLRLEPWKKAK